MPTYSYRCTECGTERDVRQSFTDDPLTVCPDCGGALRKLFSPVGVVFKGSGFYHNDSRSSRSSSTSSTTAAKPAKSPTSDSSSTGSSDSSSGGSSSTPAGSSTSSSTGSSSS
ncbi:MAG: zinc ribbon domain-containing protein [Flaviflexus sp.]|nr:zinc ribbon domain-containing protein [Flaviflexus sp.]